MTIATLKDFAIENIEEDYYTGSEFQGTWADNTCELCDVTITMYYNDKRYELTIKPADPGAYGSYGGDRGRGKGISTEILIDIIQQLIPRPLFYYISGKKKRKKEKPSNLDISSST